MKFDLNEYISEDKAVEGSGGEYDGFFRLCAEVKEAFFREWERDDNSPAMLEIQKKAIIGYEKERKYFLDRIFSILEEKGMLDEAFPEWYEDLADAVYQEDWGLAGVSEWFGEKYAESSSAKIIGSRIYFMENGHIDRKSTRLNSSHAT